MATAPLHGSGGTRRVSILATLIAQLLEELKQLGSLPPALSRVEVRSALDSGAELPGDCFAQLYRTASAALAAHLARSGGQPPLTALDTELLCRCLLSCRDLEDAIRRAADFCSAIQPRGGALTLAREAADAVFSIGPPPAPDNPAAQLLEVVSLFSYQQLFGWLIGEPLRLRAVWLTGASEVAPLPNLFGAAISTGQRRAGFHFDARQLAHPVVRQPAELANLLAAFPFHMPGGSNDPLTAAQQVRAFLNAALAQRRPLPSLAEIAAALDISTTTLRRRLREEHTSYLALRERSLLEAAKYHLRHTDRDIGQIAGALGFSDATAFRRAFHRWTGQAPSKLRAASSASSAA
jgi:AraC-like DNA-binding protein